MPVLLGNLNKGLEKLNEFQDVRLGRSNRRLALQMRMMDECGSAARRTACASYSPPFKVVSECLCYFP